MARSEICFEDLIEKGDAESLKECKAWLEAEERRITTERARMTYEQTFFDKKMDILKGGFAQLEADKKKLERERLAFEAQKQVSKEYSSKEAYEDLAGTLFAGVNSYLALKKRYRDLLKIFHPDNMCGDNEMVTIINAEYNRLKNDFEMGFRSVN